GLVGETRHEVRWRHGPGAGGERDDGAGDGPGPAVAVVHRRGISRRGARPGACPAVGTSSTYARDVTAGGGAVRALGQAVVLLLVVLAVPVAAGLVLGDAATASVTAVGAVYGVLLALRAGWRRALAVVPVLVVVSVAASSSAGSVWWVVVVGVLGLATGWSARWGWSPVLALVGAAAASAPPLPTGAPVMLRFAWVAGAAA